MLLFTLFAIFAIFLAFLEFSRNFRESESETGKTNRRRAGWLLPLHDDQTRIFHGLFAEIDSGQVK